jgi:hypothetical protein
MADLEIFMAALLLSVLTSTPVGQPNELGGVDRRIRSFLLKPLQQFAIGS